jgi:hypothetical protein
MAGHPGHIRTLTAARTVAALQPQPDRPDQPGGGIVSRLDLAPATEMAASPWAHTMARSDASGRLPVPAALRDVLGWAPGTDLGGGIDDGRYRLHPGTGAAHLDRRGRLVLTETAWRYLGLGARVAVLLSANPTAGSLTVTPTGRLDQVVS